MPGRIIYIGRILIRKSSKKSIASLKILSVIHSKALESQNHSNMPYQVTGPEESMMSIE